MDRKDILTPRMHLRRPRAEDAEWITREIAHPDVHSMLTAPPRPYTLTHAHEWLSSVIPLEWQYVIVVQRPVGVVTLDSPTWGPELGYWLQKSAWGNGYMTEACRAVLREWFALGRGEVVSGHLVANAGSAKVLRKLGFQYESAVMRKSGYYGCEVEVQRMSLTNADWLTALPATNKFS
jgi:RimJ/RimL family protein N-acetyltransferase